MPKAFLIRKKSSGRDHSWRPVTPPPSPEDEEDIISIKKDIKETKETRIIDSHIKETPLKTQLDQSSNHAFSPSYGFN